MGCFDLLEERSSRGMPSGFRGTPFLFLIYFHENKQSPPLKLSWKKTVLTSMEAKTLSWTFMEVQTPPWFNVGKKISWIKYITVGVETSSAGARQLP